MNKKWKTKWIKALRSGEYKQARRVLRFQETHNQYKYCCLGVFCNIYDPDEWGSRTISWYQKSNINKIPWELAEEMGITASQQTTLIMFNDTKKYDFSRIADWIAVNL